MSRPLRCLKTSLRALKPPSTGSELPIRGANGRRYSQFAMKTRSEEQPRSAPQRISQRGRPRVGYVDEEGGSGSGEMSDSRTHRRGNQEERTWNGPKSSWSGPPDPTFAEHLNHLFPTLSFPPELARRILTHGSHPASVNGHNGALSFMGRRVLESYLLLMVTSSSALKPTHDLDEIVARTLNSYVLGQTVGTKWGLGRAVRWTPTLPAASLNPALNQKELLRGVGLYKIQGDAVGAILGGIFFQFGASVALRAFHTRILPHLMNRSPDGLPETFNKDALAMCERMGGVDGKLLLDVAERQTAI